MKKLDIGVLNYLLLFHQARDKRLAWIVRDRGTESWQQQSGN